jgi:predicted alpha/beta hydrolase family esterase
MRLRKAEEKTLTVVPGLRGRPNLGWYPSTAAEARKQKMSALVLQMPSSDHPTPEKWDGHLWKITGKPTLNHFYIGHSLGAWQLLREISSLPRGSRVGGIVLVACPFKPLPKYPKLASFFEQTLNWGNIRRVCAGNIVIIHSKTDSVVPLDHAEELAKSLKVPLIQFSSKGHFTADEKIYELPEVLTALNSLTRKALN